MPALRLGQPTSSDSQAMLFAPGCLAVCIAVLKTKRPVLLQMDRTGLRQHGFSRIFGGLVTRPSSSSSSQHEQDQSTIKQSKCPVVLCLFWNMAELTHFSTGGLGTCSKMPSRKASLYVDCGSFASESWFASLETHAWNRVHKRIA